MYTVLFIGDTRLCIIPVFDIGLTDSTLYITTVLDAHLNHKNTAFSVNFKRFRKKSWNKLFCILTLISTLPD